MPKCECVACKVDRDQRSPQFVARWARPDPGSTQGVWWRAYMGGEMFGHRREDAAVVGRRHAAMIGPTFVVEPA